MEEVYRHETSVFENQFGLISRRSTANAIYLLTINEKKYRENNRNMDMIVIDSKKVFDRVLKDLLR